MSTTVHSSDQPNPKHQQLKQQQQQQPQQQEEQKQQVNAGCWTCGQDGHISKNCTKQPEDTRDTAAGTTLLQTQERLNCFYCGKQGHFKRDCPLLKPIEIKHDSKKDKEKDKLSETSTGSNGNSQSQGRDGRGSKSTYERQGHKKDYGHYEQKKRGRGSYNSPRGRGVYEQQTHGRSDIQDCEEQGRGTGSHYNQRGRGRGSYGRDGQRDYEQKGRGYYSQRGRGRGSYEQEQGKDYGQRDYEQKGHSERGYYSQRGRGRGDYYDHSGYANPLPIYDEFKGLPSYIDTHCHIEYLMERLRIRKYKELSRRYYYPLNYDGCITSFCDPAGLSSLLGCADQLLTESKVWGSFGFHPHHAGYLTDGLEDKIITNLKEPKCVAFGEIGLDYSEHSLSQSNMSSQKQTFKRLLTMSPIFDKPLVIHCRDAEDDLLTIMKETLQPDWKIHLHCFTGSLLTAQKFTSCFPNLYIGITGHISYNKFRQTRDVVRSLPLDRILLETDSPYMVPAGINERWSHPPMAVFVAEEIAKIKGATIDNVLKTTRTNTRDIYGI